MRRGAAWDRVPIRARALLRVRETLLSTVLQLTALADLPLEAVSRSTPSDQLPPHKGKGFALVLTRSVLAYGCAPRAASGRALAQGQLVALHASRRLRRADLFTSTKGATMSTTTTRMRTNTDEARFLAPETHQRAGGPDSVDMSPSCRISWGRGRTARGRPELEDACGC